MILRELARAPGGVAVEDLKKLPSGMRFGATAASLEEALRELAAFGLVQQEHGRYVATSERVISELQSDLSYTRAYHRSMAELGRRGLDILQKERFYLAFTVGVPVGSELLLQHEVERFTTFMLDLLEADLRRTGEGPAGVYQVNLQLFPLYRAPAKAIDDEPVTKVGD